LSSPGCALDVPKQQSTTVTNSGHSPGPSTPDLQRQQGWDRTADLAVFSRVRLIRVRPARYARVAFALVSRGPGGLIIQGDAGSCGFVQIGGQNAGRIVPLRRVSQDGAA
jgi:hypothetical protein